MTRLDAAREAAGKTRDTLAPYATTAMDTAAHYAEGARRRVAPRIEALAPRIEAAAAQAANQARCTARTTYVQHLAPRVEQARSTVPPQVEEAAVRAAHLTRETALTARDAAVSAGRQARKTAGPAVGQLMEEARTTVVPVALEAQSRGAAALAALRNPVTAAEIERLGRRHERRRRYGRVLRGLLVVGVLAGGSAAAWQWWRRQSNPEWLVEPPYEERSGGSGARASDQVRAVSATGIVAADAATQNTVDGSHPVDPEVQAKQDKDKDGQNGH
ncbi:DUF5324 family protein [Streptacidiphilus griseoplanus]|uniref:DUF5324 family protein n=1 Tax=Peterkaempfera griseoplana TaxID=66896 RepID=UPI0006E3D5B5|nr:DUF5324 family protein [Peterkaempfera griseoplana]